MANLQHDGEIHIASYPSRQTKVGQNKKLQWSAFLDQLLSTTRTKETIRDYFKMGREEQDTIKDVGGFVGGWLKGGRRKTGCVEHRTLLTLDADLAQADFFVFCASNSAHIPAWTRQYCGGCKGRGKTDPRLDPRG